MGKSTMSANESPLSKRAQSAKQDISKNEVVKAVVIPADDVPTEISYNSSSKQANKILNGRPTIVGELEAIQVVIVRSLNQQSSIPLNKNTLPVPFCNKSYRGNYLLYRVDATGNTKDFTVAEYNKFVVDNQTLTEQAQKEFNPVDGQEIGANKSPFGSNSGLTMVYLQSEVDKQIRADFKKANGRNPSDAEIEVSVAESVNKLVNDLIAENSPMNDPDYNPNDEDEQSIISKIKKVYYSENGIEIDNATLIKSLRRAKQEQCDDEFDDVSDQRDWRLQLKDALTFVRQRGQADGRALAERISSTFYELNGVEPSLNELVEVFRRIKTDLADEAAEDMADGATVNIDAETTALSKQLSADMDVCEVVDIAQKIVANNLVSTAMAEFGQRTPTKQELKSTVEKLAMALAECAINKTDTDYDPKNAVDQKQARCDDADDQQFNSCNVQMFKTQTQKSKCGQAESYDVYFGEQHDGDLASAIASFKMRNKCEPNALQVNEMKQFVATHKATTKIDFQMKEDEEVGNVTETANKSKVLITPEKTKNGSSAYNVYFDVTPAENEEAAIKWFNRFNNRKPNAMELKDIQQFVKHDKTDLIECEFDVETAVKSSDDSKSNEVDATSALDMKTSGVEEKKGKSTKYNLDFVDDEARTKGNNQQAAKWFEIFNKRKPNKEEQAQIANFVKADMEKEEVIDID